MWKETKKWIIIMTINMMNGQDTRDSNCLAHWIMMMKIEKLTKFMIWLIDKWIQGGKQDVKKK